MSRNISLASFLFLVVLLPVFPRTVYHQDLQPVDPRIMGMGNGYTAIASGLASLWTNPAGLSKEVVTHLEKKDVVTAFSFSFWTQPFPGEVIGTLGGFFQGNFDGLNLLTSTGMRLGFQMSGGYITQGTWGSLGLGLMNITDVDMHSTGSISVLKSKLIDQFQFMVGYGYQFIFSNFLIRFGASVRPLLRSTSSMKTLDILEEFSNRGDISKALDSFYGYHGFGFANDVGMQFEWEGLMLGVDVHNIYTPLFYTEAPVIQFFTGAGGMASPSDYFVFPLSMNIGVAYNMSITEWQWLEQYFDATVYFQFTDPFYFSVEPGEKKPEFFTRMHFGLEFEILKPFITIQVGMNKGAPTFGMGFDIWLVDLAFSVYTEEAGKNLRERTTPGFAVELAFRW